MKKSIKYAVLPAVALALLGAGVVSAQGMGEGGKMRGGEHRGGFSVFNDVDSEEFANRQSERFAIQAELTGISVDEIKEAWADGKNMHELLTEKGIDVEKFREQMKSKAKEKMKEHVQSLVTKGVITQEQADTRIEFMKNHVPEVKGKMKGRLDQKMGASIETKS